MTGVVAPYIIVTSHPARREREPYMQAWRTDSELAAARHDLAATIPGFVAPASYGIARVDSGTLTFGAVNAAGSSHRLPAVVLASVCGYTDRTGTYPLTREQLAAAAVLLAPAEAATHVDHPNLWSWRELLTDAGPASTFLAFFVATDGDDEPVDADDAEFRALLRRSAGA
ncbi:hypothetical protein [Occultella kanbiaonis]|uniref:hypothetical protein n=1 Tax=Occultella kanbiaonis TaxID=2675754 RepID=UPI0012B7B9B7|nr:hypothetical protein [Occultella kanbiaonis]